MKLYHSPKNPNAHLTVKDRDRVSYPTRVLLKKGQLKGVALIDEVQRKGRKSIRKQKAQEESAEARADERPLGPECRSRWSQNP